MPLQNGASNEEDQAEAVATPTTSSKVKTAWLNNKGAFLILFAQVFGTSMDAIVRFVQQGEHRMHPFQIIVARMSTTFLISIIYMWWTSVPDFLLGKPGVRGWLLLRASSGFAGLFCWVYSFHYLPLSEVKIFALMVPIVTALECSVFLGTRFARTDLFAGLVALLGVVLIAHPTSIFGNAENDVHSKTAGEVDEVTPTQRLLAIGAASLGIFCASTAYTLIRVIGNRAHALVSVSYFSLLSTVCSTIALLVIPGIGFTLPEGPREWILLLLLGLFGFALQFLLTAGLQLDKSSKATSMMYSQIVFALLCDWAIWGVLPGFWSFIGGAIVIASTLWSALQKFQGNATEPSKTPVIDEETSLLGAETEGAEDAALRRASISA